MLPRYRLTTVVIVALSGLITWASLLASEPVLLRPIEDSTPKTGQRTDVQQVAYIRGGYHGGYYGGYGGRGYYRPHYYGGFYPGIGVGVGAYGLYGGYGYPGYGYYGYPYYGYNNGYYGSNYYSPYGYGYSYPNYYW